VREQNKKGAKRKLLLTSRGSLRTEESALQRDQNALHLKAPVVCYIDKGRKSKQKHPINGY